MRVMAWNTNWNISAETLGAQCDATALLGPELAFFSEWSPSPTRTTSSGERRSNGHLRGPALAERGYEHLAHEHVSDRAHDGRNWSIQYWGILAASRSPIAKVDVDVPLFAPGTWLEVRHHDSGFTFVGVRMVAWQEQRRRKDYWSWMLEQFERLSASPAVVIGDFNTELTAGDGSSPGRAQAKLLSTMAELGWRDADSSATPAPTHIRNNGAPARLDYALVSPAAGPAVHSRAVTQIDGVRLLRIPAVGGVAAVAGLSDHAPVIAELAA